MTNFAYYLLSTLSMALVILLVTSFPRLKKSEDIVRGVEGIAEELTVEQVGQQDGLPVYWLGETYRGLPIVNIKHLRDPGSPDGVRPPSEHVTIIYASCGAQVGDCPPGEMASYVSVRSEWLCLKPPSLLARGAREGPTVQIRGAQVQKTTSGSTHAFFANSTVIVYASEGEEVTLEALDSLEGLNPSARAVAATRNVQLGPPVETGCTAFVLPTPAPTATAEPALTRTPVPSPATQSD
jgi:hypothetical protein